MSSDETKLKLRRLVCLDISMTNGGEEASSSTPTKTTHELLENSLADFTPAIQSCHVLYGNRHILIVLRDDCADLDATSLSLSERLFSRLHLAVTNHRLSESSEIFLTGQLTERQRALLESSSLSSSLSQLIEAKTGLQPVGPAAFSGYTFQFQTLGRMLADLEETTTTTTGRKAPNSTTVQALTRKERTTSLCTSDAGSSSGSCGGGGEPLWPKVFAAAEVKLKFRLAAYDVYVMQADVTELDADGLVNATNSELHPGYDGSGVARTIREKGLLACLNIIIDIIYQQGEFLI